MVTAAVGSGWHARISPMTVRLRTPQVLTIGESPARRVCRDALGIPADS
jgi:hypothetical protein